MSDKILSFGYEPVGGNGRVALTVKLDGQTLAVDKLDVLSANARDRFAKGLCEDRPGIDQAAIDRELLSIAAEVEAAAIKGKQGPRGDSGAPELDVRRIVRPDRIITPEVSGLSVAVPTLRDGRPTGRWMLYLAWADGRREVLELPESIPLQDGGTLWVHPVPGEPGVRSAPAWTAAARKGWLGGADTPDPAEVFRGLCKCLAYYIDFPAPHAQGTAATLALWVLLSYCYPAWPAVSYLYLGGPHGSGKTRVFEVLSRLVFRPLESSNMTAAALFRTLHDRGGTLLYDEAERLKQNTPDVGEINSMLLAGYKRDGRASRLEPVGDSFRMREFHVFGPKALACIRGLPGPLSSRCIPIIMFRAGEKSPKPRRRIDRHGGRWESLRADLHALALDCGAEFLELVGRADVCPEMSGRSFELWQPLLALASWIESYGAKGLLSLMQTHAAGAIASGQDEQTPDCDEALLRVLAGLVDVGRSPIAREILDGAREEEYRMFEGWSAKGVANALRRYGIETHKTHGRRAYGHVTRADLQRIQTTYNMDLGLPETDGEDTGGQDPKDMPQVPQVPPKGENDQKSAPTGGTWGT